MAISAPKAITFVITILIILTTGSLPGCYVDITKLEIVLALICIMMAFTNGINYKDAKRIGIVAISLIGFSLLEFLIYPQMLLEWFRFPFLLISYSLFCCAYSHRIDIINCYYNAFMVLCVLSTFMYILVEVLQIPIPYTITGFDWMPEFNAYGYVYFRMNILKPDVFGPITIMRNCGFYTEPGLYSVFIVLNLYIYLFIRKKRNWFHLAVLLFALITTVSATGWLAFLMMIAFKIMYSEKYSNAARNLVVGSIVLLAAVVIVYAVLLQKATYHVNSYTSRGFDLIQGFKIFLQSPIWGWGYKNTDVYSNVAATFAGVYHEGRVNSNGVMCVLYQMGLIGSMIYLIPAYLYIKNHSERHTYERKRMIMFCFLLAFLIMCEPVQYDGIIIAILALFIANLRKTNTPLLTRKFRLNEIL